MSRRMGLALLVMVLGVWLAAPALAQVAPQYQSSDPSNGASVQKAPSSVQITFSEPLDDSSSASITNACGESVGGATSVSFNEMTIDLSEGHYSGKYTVVYEAVGIGGVTGSTTGQMSFSAAEGHPCGDEPKPPCHHNPDDCNKPPKPCHHDPNAEGCKKDDPCHHDPDAAGCKKDDPCHHDPDAAGCKGDGHNGEHGNDDDHTDGHNGMGTDHSGGSHSPSGGHSGTEHSGASGEHGNGEHGNGHGNRNHASGPIDGEPSSGFFSGEVPDLTTVALALGLCALLGAIGGVFLRVNANA